MNANVKSIYYTLTAKKANLRIYNFKVEYVTFKIIYNNTQEQFNSVAYQNTHNDTFSNMC